MENPGTRVVQGVGRPLSSLLGQARPSQKGRCLGQAGGSFLPLGADKCVTPASLQAGLDLTKRHFTF